MSQQRSLYQFPRGVSVATALIPDTARYSTQVTTLKSIIDRQATVNRDLVQLVFEILKLTAKAKAVVLAVASGSPVSVGMIDGLLPSTLGSMSHADFVPAARIYVQKAIEELSISYQELAQRSGYLHRAVERVDDIVQAARTSHEAAETYNPLDPSYFEGAELAALANRIFEDPSPE